MSTTIHLKGMTWSDPRGYDPVVAAAHAFSQKHPHVSITWDKRSLQGFEITPVDELAAAYDLMIIDHPHVGSVAGKGHLLAFDQHASEASLAALANETLGKSYISYNLHGHQWALPVDAATQVQACRPDLTERATTWAQIVDRAREGTLLWALRSPHTLMNFYTLAANIGHPCGSSPDEIVNAQVGEKVFEALLAVSDHVDPMCFDMDPIAILDVMATEDRFHTSPFIYLYKGYSDAAYRPHRIAFTDIPTLGKSGPIGSALGGTGLAVSAKTKHPEICIDFALWVAGADCQSTLYTQSNGQPGNAVAWGNEAVNAPVMDAYFNTRQTHESAWLRPRHDGYMGFQEDGSTIVNDVLQHKTTPANAMQALNARYAASFA
ncbi:extracellular solute-binding protein [Falsihalocynthiibacter sp. BN13B15]|uniref:extracellular solute-binding protein n=1 Tax=Falsihalocynthiibacter sp. BN13B15 TaxID=3240871 RepID=UPI003510277B